MIDSKFIADCFRTHAAAMRLYARQLVSAAEAEDVVNDVFVRLIALAQPPRDAKAWLFRSVRNAAISHSRSIFRRRRRESGIAEPWFDARTDDLIDARMAEAALCALRRVEREVIVLRIWSEMTFQEIADLIGASVTTVFDRYKSGLSTLRLRLERERSGKAS
jgi:RNA polymerase sigma factor (sigma-70 family)